MEKLFSYGTLQQEDVQMATFGRRLSGQKSAIVGYRRSLLEITDPAVVATSGKTHHPIVSRSDRSEDRIEGTVFLVTPRELAAADSYEVGDYERVLASLAEGGEAWVYVARCAEKT
jgi:gamma-glutamylcyclotransferase (GGCT)/AIG2-like uncharacterized protein YtfP